MLKTKPLCLLALLMLLASAAPAKTIPADDPNLQYTGRIDFSDKKAPLMSWAGTSIKTKFTGTSLKVRLKDAGIHLYYVFIDGDYDNGHVITCQKGEHTYDVASGLEDKTHDLLIYKRTDGGSDKTAFLGLEIDDDAELADPGPRPKLKMEIYGDSISTGLGCDRKRGKEHSREATDNFFSYGAITARNLDAELHCISKSGIGLIKSWWPTIMPQYYDRACATSLEGKGEAWDFSQWSADLVVINIFQNDSWTRKQTTQDEAVSAYTEFVTNIRGHYPEADIVCVLGSMDASKGKWAGFVKESVKQLNDKGDKKVHAYIFKVQTGHTHPNSKDHAKMAEELTRFLGTLGLDVSQGSSLPEAAEAVTEVKTDFKPDPDKTYYIDCPALGGRLSADGGSVKAFGETFQLPKAVKTTETGDDVQWKFVPARDKWFIQLAKGGDSSRLRAVNVPSANGVAMTHTKSSGGWTQFEITGASNGKLFITAPEGPKDFKRLRFLDGGKVGMANPDNTEADFQFTITEVEG